MDDRVFQALSDIVYEGSGIVVGHGKEPLVAARLSRRLTELGLADERGYLEYLRNDRSGAELVTFIDAIATNVTQFFREPRHFAIVAQLVDRWLTAGQRRFRFWCAGCSSGEEPYTLAMVLEDNRAMALADYKILATDISTRMLVQAHEGVFQAEAVAPVPLAMRKAHFTTLPDGRFAVSAELKRRVLFRHFNLARLPAPVHGELDIIFCRNVMIYFDEALRSRLVSEFVRLLRPNGHLIIGHAESLPRRPGELKITGPSVYRKREPREPASVRR